MCSAMADLAGEDADSGLMEASAWNLGEHDDTADVHYRRNQVSGFRERFTTDYDLPNSTNYSETCASIGVMMFRQRMAAITGDTSDYDYVEKALYNTVIAGINHCRRPVLLCKTHLRWFLNFAQSTLTWSM